MNNSVQNMERFDAYLRNELSAEERTLFEQELHSNPAFREEFHTYQEFIETVHDGAEYGEIRQQLRNIHNKPGVAGRTFFLTPQFLIPLASVAAIALLITIINPFVKQGNETAEAGDYQNLNHAPAAVDSEASAADTTFVPIPHESSSDDGAYKGSPDFLAELKSSPAGTAFLISEDGYFLTSKHLVDKQQQVRLQQKDDKMTFEAVV